MASTDPGADAGSQASPELAADAPIRVLGAPDLPCALELSRAASWNQNEADWRMMLELGRGWGIRPGDGEAPAPLAASIVVLPYGEAFAWVSMVLVLPGFRGRGYAQRLLRHALGQLARNGSGGVLDATPAGHPVYVREGFIDSWGFRRYRCESASPTTANATGIEPGKAAVRPLDERDWEGISALDRVAFGGDRTALLRRLAARLPGAAHVVERDGRLEGFVLGRDGREATQLGPLVCDDDDAVPLLLDAALSSIDGPVYVDALDRHGALLDALARRGFAEQRPFTRMLHALERAPGDDRRVYLVAGPELG